MAKAFVANKDYIKAILPVRKVDSNKGSYGNALIVAGCNNMPGAAVLAVKGALKSGVGLVTAASSEKCCDIICNHTPLPVFIKYNTPYLTKESSNNVIELSNKCNIALIGCGLSRQKGCSDGVYNLVTSLNIPIIFDADGINAISDNINILKETAFPSVITPHIAEMARLCGTSIDDVKKHPIKYATDISKQYNTIVVLKDSRTIVVSPKGKIYYNLYGNNGMAKGGSGDVLAGIIVGITAQNLIAKKNLDLIDTLFYSSICGVYLHSVAGDIASKRLSVYSMSPEDIIDSLPEVFISLK